MRLVWLVMASLIGVSAYATPPRDATGQFRDWFRDLTVPGVPGAPCCTVADCRMVDARWNDQTQHHEARVDSEVFSGALRAEFVPGGQRSISSSKKCLDEALD